LFFITHQLSFRPVEAVLTNIFRVAEGKRLDDAKSIPVSIFMKRIRGVPFPRFSLPVDEKVEGGESADEEDDEWRNRK
jgi:hypothetical protein